MCALRRVEDADAGPEAIGILVPPGRRTVVILRPRRLTWDLLVMTKGLPLSGPPFHEFDQASAVETARGLYRTLDAGAAPGSGFLESLPEPAGDGYWVRAQAGLFSLIACPRIAGQPYRPMHFETESAARSAAAALAEVLFPADDREQEIYFNTRHFAR
jgi:hypothetical protein